MYPPTGGSRRPTASSWRSAANGPRRADITEALQLLHALPIVTDDETTQRSGRETIALARQYVLTSYDAAYLELAMRRKGILVTLDEALAAAASDAGVSILN